MCMFSVYSRMCAYDYRKMDCKLCVWIYERVVFFFFGVYSVVHHVIQGCVYTLQLDTYWRGKV